MQVNPTTFSHFRALLQEHPADLVAMQEVMRTPEGAIDAMRTTNGMGFHANVNASSGTVAGGLSAGVALASRWQFGLLDIDMPLTPTDSWQ